MTFRQFDMALGRFHGIDKLASSQHSITPYHFGNNNPIAFSDPSGLIPQYQDPDQGSTNFQNVAHWGDGYGNRENRSHWSDPFNNGLFSGGPGHDANQTFFRNMMSDADFFLATTSNKGKRIVSPRYFAPTPTLESGSLMVYSSSSNQINCYDPVDLRNDSPQEILDKSSSNIAHYLRGRYDRGVMRAAGNSVETPETRISDFFNLNGYGYYDKIGFGEDERTISVNGSQIEIRIKVNDQPIAYPKPLGAQEEGGKQKWHLLFF